MAQDEVEQHVVVSQEVSTTQVSSQSKTNKWDETEEDIDIDEEWEKSLSSVSSKSFKVMHVCPFEGCSMFFKKRAHLEQHRITHTKERPFACPEPGCKATYGRKSHLERHFDSVHRNTTFTCAQCPSTFRSKQAMKKHERKTHGQEASPNRFKCEECNKTFTKKNHLQAHISGHSGTKPHRCDICGQQFTFPNKLRRHMSKHSHKCVDCGTEFSTYQALRKHKSMEHKKKYNCSICGHVSSVKSNFISHVKTHEDMRDVFHCPLEACNSSFLHFSNLKNHVRIAHDGLRYFCDHEDCTKSFSSRRGLLRHSETHKATPNNEKPLKDPKAKKSRKDKGQAKRAMAVFLSNIEIDKQHEEELLRDKVSSVETEEINREIASNEKIKQDFQIPDDTCNLEVLSSEICQRNLCNQGKVKKARVKELEQFLNKVGALDEPPVL